MRDEKGRFIKGHKALPGWEKGAFKKGHKILVPNEKRPRGKNHYNWKGDKVGYAGIHEWVYKTLGKAKKCSRNVTHFSKRFEWSSISGKYLRDINDWEDLCIACHRKKDAIEIKMNLRKSTRKFLQDNGRKSYTNSENRSQDNIN